MWQRQLEGQARTLQCSVWSKYVLPARKGPLSILISQRGSNVEDKDLPAVEAFVSEITASSIRGVSSASQLEPFERLARVLGAAGDETLAAPLMRLLKTLTLPSGAAYGDLHIGNIVKIGKSFRVIDCDRFCAQSSPLFDRLHFRLTRAQGDNKRKWLETLIRRQDVVAEVATGFAKPEALCLAYAVQRIVHEGEGALRLGLNTEKYVRQARQLLEFARALLGRLP